MKTFPLIFCFFIIALFGYALFRFSGVLLDLAGATIALFDSRTLALLILGSLLPLICASIISRGNRRATILQNDFLRRNDRARIYQAVLEEVAKGSSWNGNASSLTRSFFLLGNPDVINAYRSLRQLVDNDASLETIESQLNRLLFAMRRDLGESNVSLEGMQWGSWIKSSSANCSPAEEAPLALFANGSNEKVQVRMA